MSDSVVLYECAESVARITLNNAPVNALSLALRQQLFAALDRAARDARVSAVVIDGAGRCFSAGGDIREFGTPAVTAAPRLTLDVQPAIESMQKPVVAAIHGMALGGGLETAMACHFRVAAAETIIALPEVKLGVIPLSGTQRLPRLVPLKKAIDLPSGAQHRASEYTDTALFDRIIEGATDTARLFEEASAIAREAACRGPPYPLVSRRPIVGPEVEAVLAAAAAELDRDAPSNARRQALAAIAVAVESVDFASGLRAANAICEVLLASEETRASAMRFLAARGGSPAV